MSKRALRARWRLPLGLALIGFLVAVLPAHAETATISRYAGVPGSPGYGGDGGSATGSNAKLNTPKDVALDESTGDLYIADTYNNLIRKVASDGALSKIAGRPLEPGGFDGDGIAFNKLLNKPSGIAFLPIGGKKYLYVADTENNRVRQIDLSAVGGPTIETVAGGNSAGSSGDGGPSREALLNKPFGVGAGISGGQGILFIADTNNHMIRRIINPPDPNANINRVAGVWPPSAGNSGEGGSPLVGKLNQPHTVVHLGQGATANPYIVIADTNNHRLMRVQGGTMTRIVGTGAVDDDGCENCQGQSAKLNFPRGISSFPKDGPGILIADTHNHRVRWWDASSGLVKTLVNTSGTEGYSGDDGGAATDAKLRFPKGVVAASNSNFWIADTMNHLIRFDPEPAAPEEPEEQEQNEPEQNEPACVVGGLPPQLCLAL